MEEKKTHTSLKGTGDCIYCSNISDGSFNNTFFQYDTPIFSVEGIIEAGNVMATYLSDLCGEDYIILGTSVINFCPFCGKKLESNENERDITRPQFPHSFKAVFENL